RCVWSQIGTDIHTSSIRPPIGTTYELQVDGTVVPATFIEGFGIYPFSFAVQCYIHPTVSYDGRSCSILNADLFKPFALVPAVISCFISYFSQVTIASGKWYANGILSVLKCHNVAGIAGRQYVDFCTGFIQCY